MYREYGGGGQTFGSDMLADLYRTRTAQQADLGQAKSSNESFGNSQESEYKDAGDPERNKRPGLGVQAKVLAFTTSSLLSQVDGSLSRRVGLSH
jgi:hypothetical protein